MVLEVTSILDTVDGSVFVVGSQVSEERSKYFSSLLPQDFNRQKTSLTLSQLTRQNSQ